MVRADVDGLLLRLWVGAFQVVGEGMIEFGWLEDVLVYVLLGVDLIVLVVVVELVMLFDTLEVVYEQFDGVCVHCMDLFCERVYIRGELGDYLCYVDYYFGFGLC